MDDGNPVSRDTKSENCNDSLKSHALYYATEKHWPIFPCKRDKTPLVQGGVLSATTNPKQIEEWWTKWPNANIGLNVGEAGMMVLDLDPGYDKAELAKAIGELPSTGLHQKTPRGGLHLFFQLNHGEIVAQSTSKLAPHVDVRSFHSYVLLAPSETDAGTYELADKGPPSSRTDKMLRVANTAKGKHKERDEWIIEPDQQKHIDQATDWLKYKAEIAIEGQGGDNRTFATAAMCKSFGLSPDKALELMLEYWNPRCEPPWEVEDLQTKVENAYAYNTSPPGNMTDEYQRVKDKELFKPVISHEQGMIDDGKFRRVSRSTLHTLISPPWLVRDFLHEGGYGIIGGAPSTFKTFIAIDIGLSVATGCNSPWEGPWEVLDQGDVIYVAGEGRSLIEKRIQAWEQKHWHGQQVPNFYIIDPVPNAGLSTDWDRFLKVALEKPIQEPKLIILDTIGRAMQGLNENSQQDASKFTQMVATLQAKTDAAVLALHHIGHDARDRLRGSTVFPADADTVILLDRRNSELQVSLTMQKQKDVAQWERSKAITLEKVDGSLVAVKPQRDQELPIDTRKAFRETRAKKDQEAILHFLNDAVTEFLRKSLYQNPTRHFPDYKLAESIATEYRDTLSVGSDRLRKYYLKRLRELPGYSAAQHYDTIRNHWKYKGNPLER